MRVYQLEDHWGLDNLKISQRPEPIVGPGQIIVQIRASSLNFRDLVVLDRGYGQNTGKLPLIPVSDGAGDVVAVGPGVTRVKVGDRVCPTFFQAWTGGAPRPENFSIALGGSLDGTMTDLMLLSDQGVVKIPDWMSYEQAATLPCAALTAWSAIVTTGQIKAGDRILVQGSGGVAQFALAFAKANGAHVTMISSSNAKLERLRGFGADACINYVETPEWAKATREIVGDQGGYDNIIELGGETTFSQSLRCVRPGGTISLIGVLSGLNVTTSLGPIVSRQVRLQGITVGSRAGFEDMLRAMDQARISPVIDSSFAFEDLKPALAHLKSGKQFGKIVIKH